jgi:molecular chaperone GrpE
MKKRSSTVSENDLDNDGQAPETDPVEESPVVDAEETMTVDSAPAVRGSPEAAVAAEREKYLRLAAEFDNYRKRSIRERQEAGSRAQAEVVQGLIEVLDDIMRFAHLDPATVDSTTVVQGVAMVERKIMKTLSGHGLEVIDPMGRPFDPAFHEAVATEPATSEEEDHLVARVYQPGYVFRGQLVRPARVVVKQWLS